jgi:DNA gyrase subunit A
MEIGFVKKVNIDHEMQQSYLDYAMSVIVARALPDARDGLKPVQRRLLFAMYDMGLRPESSYKKSARIVGEVLGKYHPHGDQAVYESMARLAQDFSLRYPMVDGQGNFGSVDGDPPAAMRYTEARITHFSLDMLNQIDRNTIDFVSNFDETLEEPVVLPSAIPNLLVNGASGIAVGMATSIPPHNLAEVVDACQYMLKNWEKLDDVTVGDLMGFVKGPDFPTGGLIIQQNEQDDIMAAYGTGRGKVMVRGKVSLEEMTRGKSKIIINELPYMTNKASLIERIAELARESSLEGISDLRDESDRQGMRIVIELNKSADAEKVLRELYKKTPLQGTFSINLLALVDGQPRLLTLKQALKVYLEHRIDVVRRRCEYDLKKALERLHILEGYRIAISALDEIIATIRASQDTDQAKQRLMKKFKLSDLQAQAILDMPLKRLAALERKKIEMEYKEIKERVKELETILKSPIKMREEVGNELAEIRLRYQDRRRTHIISLKKGEEARELLTVQDMTPAEKVWVAVTREGKLFRTHDEKAPKAGGKEAPWQELCVDTHQILYLLADDGKCATVSVHNLPVFENAEEAPHYSRITTLEDEEKLIKIFSLPTKLKEGENEVIVTLSKAGLIKKSSLQDLPGVSSQSFTLAKVNEGDELVGALISAEKAEYLIATNRGMAIRFAGEEVRLMGLVAAGVNAIKLPEGAAVIGLLDLARGDELVFICSDGFGWRFKKDDFPVQGRYGQGVTLGKMKSEAELTGCVSGKRNQSLTVFLKKTTAKVIKFDVVPLVKRGLAVKDVLELKPGNEVVSVSLLGSDETSSPKEGRKSGSSHKSAPREIDSDDYKQEGIF